MPKLAPYLLAWSPLHHMYELHDCQENEVLDLIPESPARFVWATQVSSFAFHGMHGSYTARKERQPRGEEGYWYAYARVGGKLTKRYLGRCIDLTLARLEQIAQELWLEPQTEIAGAGTSARERSSETLVPLANDTTVTSASAHRCHHSARLQGGSPPRQQTPPVISPLPSDPPLVTKLHVPPLSAHVLHRPRLIQRLHQGLQRPLILLSAPAGFGKSTLLAAWLTSSRLPAAWLSLEPQDNELARFLSCLLAALQTYDPHLATAVQPWLTPLSLPSVETILTMLINELDKRSIGQHVVLVLEDYHVITAQAIHHTLSFLLDHLPPHVHLVLSTREDPPLPLARLRGREAVVEVRACDLQFTHEETTTYLVKVMGLPLSTEQSTHLQVRTEGWITGLQLAAHSLQDHDDPAGFITTFSGSHRYVVDYLLEEVLHRQPAAMQDFLLQTCILEYLCPPLCDAVRAQDGSQAFLDRLERASGFLVALDDRRQWYRYHPLFAQVLRQRLQQTAPTLILILHQRASSWYEQHGAFPEAVSHALAASAFEEAARLIEQYAWVYIASSQMQTLCQWLGALPETLFLAHPSLCVMHAIALMYTNHLETAAARLRAVERGGVLGEHTPGRGLLGQMVACRDHLASLSGDLEQCVALSHRALDLLPRAQQPPLTWLLRVGAMLGAAHRYLLSGDVRLTNERLLAGVVADTRILPAYWHLTLSGLTLLARLQVLQGRLHQAAATYEETVQLAPRPEALQVLAKSPAYCFGLGALLCEWNELEAAEDYLAQGMDLLRGTCSVDADEMWLGYATLARLEMARGRYWQALRTLDTFLQVALTRHFASVLVAQCAAMRAQVELTQGHLHAAHRWANSRSLSAIDVLCYPREREYLTLARVRIAQERVSPTESGLAEVRFVLERLLAEAEARTRMRSVLEILLLLALTLQVQGDHTGALSTLEHALVLAEPEGYFRLFLDEGPPMVALLQKGQQRGLAPAYITKLLAACSRAGASHPPVLQPGPLMEPLTARERDVLQLLLEGVSNREIADQLIVNVNTVKRHISNICGKLNVHSRAQAIVRAQRLHLL